MQNQNHRHFPQSYLDKRNKENGKEDQLENVQPRSRSFYDRLTMKTAQNGSDNKENQKDMAQLISENRLQAETFAHLQGKLEKLGFLQDEVRRLSSENKEKDRKIAAQEHDLETKKDEIEGYMQRNGDLDEKVIKLEEELKDQKIKTIDAQKERDQAVQRSNDLEQKVEDLQKEVEDQKTRADELEKALDVEKKSQVNRNVALEGEVKQLRLELEGPDGAWEQLDDLKNRLEVQEAREARELQNLRSELEEQKRKDEEDQKIRTEALNVELEAKYKTREKEVNKGLIEHWEKLEKDAQDANEKVEELEKELIKEKKRAGEKMRAKDCRIEELERQGHERENYLEGLQFQLDDLERKQAEEVARAKSQGEAMQATRINDLGKSLEIQKREVLRLNKALTDLKNKSKEALEKKDEEIRKQKTTLEECKRESEARAKMDTRRIKELAQKSQEAAKDAKEQADRRIQRLQEKLKDEKQTVENLKKNIVLLASGGSFKKSFEDYSFTESPREVSRKRCRTTPDSSGADDVPDSLAVQLKRPNNQPKPRHLETPKSTPTPLNSVLRTPSLIQGMSIETIRPNKTSSKIGKDGKDRRTL